RVRAKAPIAIDRGRGEDGGSYRVLEQPGEIRLPRGREQLAAGEQVLARVIHERLVQMPAARVVALERRARHERRKTPLASADLPRRGAKEQQVVRSAQCILGGEGALDLPRTPFVLDGAQRQPERGVRLRKV